MARIKATPSSTRIGVIDLGTNSVRFDVHQIGAKKRPRLLHREKLMVRLGEDVFTTGKLDPKASRRTLEAFASFAQTSTEMKVSRTVAFATSALREAADSAELLRAVKEKTGIDLRVISGAEEARLIAAGILAHQRGAKGCFALVDIGGGSTEISVCEGGKVLESESFPLGAARLQQVFLKTAPPLEISEDGTYGIQPLRAHIRQLLLARMTNPDWPRPDRIIGSSGTIKALGRLLKHNTGEKLIGRSSLRKLVKFMSRKTPAELEEMDGLEPKRVDLILAGAILLEECMDVLEVKRVQPTLYSLRDGILFEEIRRLEPAPAPALMPDLGPSYARACQFGGQRLHLRKMVETAENLFDGLRPVHQLGDEWRRLLLLAVLYRDTGRAISPVHHERHSHYIVLNSELPVAVKWEIELVAELVLRHDGVKQELGELPFKGEKMEAQRRAFPKLLALLRIIDALDPAHHQVTSRGQIQIRPDGIHLHLNRGNWMELAALRLQEKKALFEKVFERPLIAQTD